MRQILVHTIVSCLSAAFFSATAWSTPESLVTYVEGSHFYKWSPSQGKYAISQPFVLEPAASGGADQMQIGFTHSGYTTHSPRRADLLVTVELSRHDPNESEGKLLEQQGYRQLNMKQQLRSVTLDLTLSADPIEEQRLRSLLHLPRQVQLGTLTALSMHWENVSGDVLYAWLTEPNGLQLVARGVVVAAGASDQSWSFKPDKFDSWWNLHAGSASTSYEWTGGATPLAYEMAANGLIEGGTNELSPVDQGPDVVALSQIAQSVDQRKRTQEDGTLSITKDDLIATAADARSQVAIVFQLRPIFGFRPGSILDQHPEYIIDASGGGKGLRAIRGK